MKIFLQIVIIIFLISLPIHIYSQNFSWQADTTTMHGAPGEAIYFHTLLTNNTASQIKLRIIRTVNNIPAGWFSSLCSGGINGLCYHPDSSVIVDSIDASSQKELGINIVTDLNPDQGVVTMRVEEWSNPSSFLTESFSASTMPTKIRHSLPVTGEYRLYTNYPNPFNPSTTIPFEIGGQKNQRAIIVVYNVVGQMMKKIFDGYLTPGIHQVSWDGRDALGRTVSSGIYFIELRTEQQFMMGKMFLLK
jgi:hypothetical protein